MKIGFTCSAFDLLHAGHILMLEEAAKQCDYLIVGLQTNPSLDRKEKKKPIQSVVERYIQLKAVKYVDEIIPYDTEGDLEEIIKAFPINIRIIGEEYRNKEFTGNDICQRKNIEIYYNSRDHHFSSSELRDRTYVREYHRRDDIQNANRDNYILRDNEYYAVN